MPEPTVLPVIAPAAFRPSAEPPQVLRPDPAQGPKIVPAFRFVPSVAPILADHGHLAPGYASAHRAADVPAGIWPAPEGRPAA